MEICHVCGESIDNLQKLSTHIKNHKLTIGEYYKKYLATDSNEGTCKICGGNVARVSLRNGFATYCSIECAKKDKEYIVSLLKPFSKKEISCDEFKDIIGNWTSVFPFMQAIGIGNEYKRALNKRKSISTKETNMRLYGVANAHTKEKKEEMRRKHIDKYGVASPFQRERVKRKARKTKRERYGDPKFTNREKFKQTIMERYDADCLTHIPGWKEKSKKTRTNKLKNYEKEHNCTNIQKLLEEYGAGWYISKIVPIELYNNIAFVNNNDIIKIKEYFDNVTKDYTTSNGENEVYEFVASLYNGKIIQHTRDIISPYELDIYIPEKKLAIEFNGTYWHSLEIVGLKKYHLNKSQACEDKGIRLIHIYEWEWNVLQEKIKMLLRNAIGVTQNRIYARQCEIRKINNTEARKLNDKVHLQGHRNASVTYGLFFNNELVQLMSFSNSKYNKNIKRKTEWEIIRGCPGSNHIVIGGVSKLLKHFISRYHPQKIFSYCDYNKFDGGSYINAGMKFDGLTGPNKWWILKDGSVVPRQPSKYKQLKAASKGEIWGSGSKRYVWLPDSNN